MEWIDCNDSLPQKNGDILVLINNKILVAEALTIGWNGYTDNDKVLFFIQFAYSTDDKNPNLLKKEAVGGSWHKPQLYAEVTHWLELPILPTKKEIIGNESTKKRDNL